MSLLQRFAERAVRASFSSLREGSLVVRDHGSRTEQQRFGDPNADPVELVVHDARFYSALAFDGHVGGAEAYAQGWWSSNDLTELVRVFVRNRETLEGLEAGWARLLLPLRWLGHALNRNTRRGSRRNISTHYDLSNDFFQLFLDETMTYSCGIFTRPDASLRDASIAKYEHMASLLELGPQHHVLEIGTGWGGFAIHAAREYGCRVTTTTISAQQFEMARNRVRDAGLEDRVTVLNHDYRDLTGRYDRLVSIEMIEAVGHEFYRTFFEKCASLLAPGGRMALQAITIEDRRYDAARREVDFIKKYIFPGSNIPSVTALCSAASTTDLRLVQANEIGLHYAETLRRWRLKFFENVRHIHALGFDERFTRLWEFYFCYCEGGFLEGAIGDVQLAFSKSAAVATVPSWRPAHSQIAPGAAA
jgi:cyclopropane-fatty-acyl-phospholipid synthase